MFKDNEDKVTIYRAKVTPELREQQRIADETWAKGEAEADAREEAMKKARAARKTRSSTPAPTNK